MNWTTSAAARPAASGGSRQVRHARARRTQQNVTLGERFPAQQISHCRDELYARDDPESHSGLEIKQSKLNTLNWMLRHTESVDASAGETFDSHRLIRL